MTQTSKEERERWGFYVVPLMHEELLRLLHDADRCAELEREIELAELAGDGADKLCLALYGRPPLPRDYLGGSGARMLHDAAARIVELEAKLQRLASVPYGNDLLLVRPLQCKYSGRWTEASEQSPVRVSLSMVGVNVRDDTLYVRWPHDAGYAEQTIYGWPLSELEPGGALRLAEEKNGHGQDEP